MKLFVFIFFLIAIFSETTETAASQVENVIDVVGFNQQFYNWIAGVGDTNDCNPNPCQNGGNCRTEDGHFKCECSPGYSGETCEISVCTTGYCKNGGNCYVTEQGKPACDCPPGFLGPQCEKEDKCTKEKNPCVNGTCSNVDNDKGYFCDCDDGFTGVNCSKVDACRPPGGPDIVCENDGYCIPNESDQGWECLCKQDFYGKKCETPNPCHNPLMDYLNPCQNGGTCTFDANFTVSCECLPEWTGDACEIPRVCDPPCNEKHGICGTDPNKSDVLVCYCESGYSGEDCSIYVCDGFVCYNGGNCTVDIFGQAECQCPKGYDGVQCETNECYPDNTSYCHNGGTCEIDSNTGKPICTCPDIDLLVPPQCDFNITTSYK